LLEFFIVFLFETVVDIKHKKMSFITANV